VMPDLDLAVFRVDEVESSYKPSRCFLRCMARAFKNSFKLLKFSMTKKGARKGQSGQRNVKLGTETHLARRKGDSKMSTTITDCKKRLTDSGKSFEMPRRDHAVYRTHEESVVSTICDYIELSVI
jgi:hypothetical protein